jgi:hypothetical protein
MARWVKITSWTNTAGNIYKSDSALSGYEANSNVAKYNGTELTKTTGTSPSSNEWSIHTDGVIYTDVGEDPDTKVFEIGSRRHKI